ncbi:MAG TPA: cyclodeaminase/cyclohydrolase family protein [Thermoplasmata archaeon]|nr:cyclodeaminase/cyclohydrolase family protein [Thermoplasmata archaeon]
MGVKEERLGEFLDAVAAPTPTTGGGSVSALAGALGAALTRMVVGLARDKKGYEPVQGDLVRIGTEAARLQERLLELVEDDSHAYGAVVAAMKLPRGNDAERAARVKAMQAAYQEATRVPLETMAACSDVLGLAAQALDTGHRGATTDAAVAVLLAEAALRGAGLNVRVNLASIKDEAFRSQAQERAEALLAAGEAASHEALSKAMARL